MSDFDFDRPQPPGALLIVAPAFTGYAYREADHRAALVRMVLAEQWAVAVAVVNGSGVWGCDAERREPTALWPCGGQWHSTVVCDDHLVAHNIAALPCAVDVVAERLGEGGAR